ncbi:hypothetical protein F8M41_005908 [Gigaspora margarita]|uniref:Uncharacterized protein n=1 Tax=Gigaspora margarita TaxID=4874 RepID=A0A8H4AX49_GIGMA|nr:hypothetical protein F8M41_005908 [Gigaspora margarita]
MSTDENSKPNELHLSNDEPRHSDDELAYSDDSDYENLDNNAWFPTGEMRCLPTKIHKDSLLPKTMRTEILKNQPHNSEIKYEAPSMDKRIWKLISPQAKETDKLLAKVAYPLKDTRSLLLDSLSYTNELRKQQSLKVILPNYAPPSDREEVFGEELGSIIEKENTTNNLFDKAADSHKRQQYQKNKFKPTYIKSNPRFGRVQRGNYWTYNRTQNQENGFWGGYNYGSHPRSYNPSTTTNQ